LNKQKMLIVAPYGIGLRDLLMNETLGSYLRDQYDLDVITPSVISDPDKWGLQTVWPMSSGGGLGAKIAGLNHRVTNIRWLLRYRHFYESTGWSNIYRMQLLTQKLRENKGGNNYDRWARFGKGILGKVLDSILSRVVLRHPNAKILDTENYSAVFIVHPADGECTIFAREATRRGIPVVTLSMGMDNLMSFGPMMMPSDLVLLWGSDQYDTFRNHHAVVNPLLKNCEASAIGGLCHDRFINGEGTAAFDAAYPHISPTTTVITYSTLTESAAPKQTESCQTALETLDRAGIDSHLIIRARPISGDDEIWEKFAEDNPDRVTIQQAAGIGFTKGGAKPALPLDAELAEIELFAATLRRSSLVLVGGLSTVYLDAHAAGVPVVTVALPPRGTSEPTASMINNDAYAADIASLGMIEFIGEHDRIAEIVSEVVVAGHPDELIEENKAVYAMQAGERDGRAGERAVAAIKSLMQR
jgi:hypothetical protein